MGRFNSFTAKVLLGAACAVVVTACGVGLDDSGGPNPDRVIKNEKNRIEYQGIEGVYSGTLSNSATGLKPFPVKFSLYTDEVLESADDDMQPAVRVVLRARLQRTDLLGDSDNVVLTGSYNSVTGDLDLRPDTNVEAEMCAAGGKNPIAIHAKVSGQSVTGTVTRDGRTWGRVALNLQSKVVNQQALRDDDADFEKMRDTFSRVQGTYEGALTRKNSQGQTYTEKVKFYLFMLEASEGSDDRGELCFRPRLQARFLRSKVGEYADVTFNNVRYEPENGSLNARTSTSSSATTSQGSSSSGSSAGTGAPGSSTVPVFEIRGSVGGTLRAQLYSDKGKWGNISLKRVSQDATVPGDSEESLERSRRMATYKEVAGTYLGTVNIGEGKVPTPIEIQIYMIEELQGDNSSGEPRYLPALRARFRYTNFDVGVGERLLFVRYYVENGITRIAMTTSSAQAGTTAGAGMASITGQVNGNIITGEFADNRGPQGAIRLTRKNK